MYVRGDTSHRLFDGVNREEARGSSPAPASRRSGVSSLPPSDPHALDLERDVPTSPEDIEALLPPGALDRRPPMRDDAEPFTLG
jgi:hypothetical protein